MSSVPATAFQATGVKQRSVIIFNNNIIIFIIYEAQCPNMLKALYNKI